MGAIAEAFVAFAQPLIDQTDGSQEQLEKAFAISQLCYNLALLPDDQRDTTLDEMRQNLGMNDAEFAEFRRSVIDPMIRRHEDMFPGMHGRRFGNLAPSSPSPLTHTRKAAPGEKYPGTDRYAPCPCGSGEKYKFCCGAKRR
jgi:SEC-C motif